MKFFLILLISFTASSLLQAKEELVVIQAVSSTGKSFVIRRGGVQGVSIGQESSFTTKLDSFTARATDVSSDFSVWHLADMRGSVPFKKGDFVTYTNSIKNLLIGIPELNFNQREHEFYPHSDWIIKGGFAMAISESVTETEAERYAGRSGLHLDFLFSKKFRYNLSFDVGIRFDQESTAFTDPDINVTSNKILLLGSLIYHFEDFKRTNNHVYIGVGIGHGLSSTTIDDTTESGTTTLLPSLQLGYINKMNSSYSFVLEGALESFFSRESYVDGRLQTFNFINTRVTVGIQF